MLQDLINKLKHLPDDRIGDGIYAAFEWSDGVLVRMYIGSKINGPMLQYDAPRKVEKATNVEINKSTVEVNHHTNYNGISEIHFKDGCWTNCYSRGNFGKKYAYGGNWSGHTKNLTPRLRELPKMPGIEQPVIVDNKMVGTVTELDCSGSWSIWYPSARAALNARLHKDEIQRSSLPEITKQHLLINETDAVIDCLNDVIEAYDL